MQDKISSQTTFSYEITIDFSVTSNVWTVCNISCVTLGIHTFVKEDKSIVECDSLSIGNLLSTCRRMLAVFIFILNLYFIFLHYLCLSHAYRLKILP
jgi:hypothetical protein